MISIIIPTIDKNGYYTRQILADIAKKVKSDYEIILLDGPEGVNEKWNLGVEQAKGEYIWIINDDIILSQDIELGLIEVLKTNKIACPISTVGKYRWLLPAIAPKANIVGWCFMMLKKNWIPIPKELDIHFGDDWIYHTQYKDIGYKGIIHHFESKTLKNPLIKADIDKRIEQDKINWLTIKKKLGVM